MGADASELLGRSGQRSRHRRPLQHPWSEPNAPSMRGFFTAIDNTQFQVAWSSAVSEWQNFSGVFKRSLFRRIEAQRQYGLDAGLAHNARGAETDLLETILARHEGRDEKDGAFVAQNSFADAGDAGGNRKAGIAFEGKDLGTRAPHFGEQVFLRWKGVRPWIRGQGEFRRPGPNSQTATGRKSPCSPITAASIERASTFKLSPSMCLRRSVSIRVPEPMTRPAGSPQFFLGYEGQNIDGIGDEQQNTVEILGHELFETSAEHADIGRQQVQARTGEFHGSADGQNDDGAPPPPRGNRLRKSLRACREGRPAEGPTLRRGQGFGRRQ